MYYVVVYMLLDKFNTYRPKVMVKGTPNIIYIYGGEVQQIRDHDGWYVWSYPHPEHWELPPRHDVYRGIRSFMFLNVNPEYWGAEY